MEVTNNLSGFEDMADDDLELESSNPHKDLVKASKEKVLYKETCKKCNGTGRWVGYAYSGTCFSCQGRGFHEFKTSPEYRAARAAKTEAKKQQAEQEKRDYEASWHEKNLEMSRFLRDAAPRWDFAQKMLDAVGSYGGLTEAQHAAVQRCMDRETERNEARQAERQAAPVVNSSGLEEAFAKAKSNGIKWPKIKLGNMKVSPASATSANAGALYVKEGDTYLGKVIGGRFLKSRECGADQEKVVVDLVNDPKGYAEAYGLRTGTCCICSRTLTNKESIARGIGPICAEGFGW